MPARLPVLEALKYPAPTEEDGEPNTIYKSILGSLTRCTCQANCSDPLLCRAFFFPRTVSNHQRYCTKMQWKARRAEIQLQAEKGLAKTQKAMKLPCILDTTLVRGLNEFRVRAHREKHEEAEEASPPADRGDARQASMLRWTLTQKF